MGNLIEIQTILLRIYLMTFNSEQFSAPYASFWKRAIAFLIDGVILNIITTVASGTLRLPTFELPTSKTELIASILISILIGWLYYSIQESSSKRATLGKRAIGLQVTDVDGARISFGRSTGRYFSAYLSALLLFIGYLIVPFTQRHQALHDLIAGTVVIQSPSRA
jgi:uncharacterized RDD family membrane protein YckC